jgi:hypothetical protein
MTERDVREALADYFREWFSNGDKLPRGELLRDADALLASDVVAQMLAEAEQRGREDNADHGMCYVHGSKALDARLAEARAEVVAAVERVCTEAERRSEGNIFGPVDWVTVPAIRAALGSAAHDCGSCPDCLHDGHKCCGCYDGACCKAGAR